MQLPNSFDLSRGGVTSWVLLALLILLLMSAVPLIVTWLVVAPL